MPTIKIALVALGERLPLNLFRMATKLNSLQKSFSFEIIGAITDARLGDPDIDGDWYNVKTLFEVLREHRRYEEYEFLVGVTRFKITEENARQQSTRSYFSLGDFTKVAVVSVSDEMLGFNSPSKNTHQYVAYILMAEVLMYMAKSDLIHSQFRSCLFDDCEDRRNFSDGIDKGLICKQDIARLEQLGVNGMIVNDACTVLAWTKRKTLVFALKRTINNPVTTLVLGVIAGWLLQLYVPASYVLLVIPIVILVIIGVFSSYYVQ